MAHLKFLPLVNSRDNLVNNNSSSSSNNPLPRVSSHLQYNSRHQPSDSTGMASELCRRNVLCLDLH